MKVIDSVLFEAFSSLSRKQKNNLRWHLKRRTRIFCGPGSYSNYVSPDGHG